MDRFESRLETLRELHPAMWLALLHQRNHKGEPLSFTDGHHFLKQIYLDDATDLVVRKSTQCGLTEFLIALSMSKLILQGRAVFYVLPDYGLQSRFIKNRLDTTVDNTPFYKSRRMETGEEGRWVAESMGLKRFGKGVIAFIGSRSRAGFTEFPADDVIIDELDECDQENIPMAAERLSASRDPRKVTIGNPTFSNMGISSEYAASDRKRWMVQCPKCRKWTVPDFFQHVVKEAGPGVYVIRDEDWDETDDRDIRLIHECGGALDRFVDGEWVAEAPGVRKSGYHVTKLFSSRATVRGLVERFNKGLVNDTEMQRFYNGDLGMPYTAKGAKVDKEMLDACIEDYGMPDRCSEPCVAGVDVGTILHVRINRILSDGRDQAVYIGGVREYADLAELCSRFNIVCGVVDAMPEIRLSRRIVQWRGWFKADFASDGADHKDRIDPAMRQVSCGRTELLDALKEKILLKRLVLPKNAASLPEYYAHMEASVRVFDEKRDAYVWIEGNAPDHLMFAEAYAHLARRIMAAAR